MATNIVPTGERLMPRIAPKVFADIPSQKELDQARRARRSATLWLVVLTTLLAAAIAFIVFQALTNKPPPVDNTLPTQVADLTKKLGNSETALTAERAKLTKLAPYGNIQVIEGNIAKQIEDIRESVRPSGMSVPSRTSAKRL